MNVALLTVSVTLLGAGFATVGLAQRDRHTNSGNTPMVLSPEDSYIRAVSGFGTELECYANTCVSKNRTVKWYKDNKLIAEGTDVFGYDGRAYIRHGITLDHTKDCNDTCYPDGPFCAPGLYCLENSCCACESEDYTLVLTNLTYEDTGTYRCQMTGSNDVEMDLEILEYGLLPSKRFYTFDHSECCEKMGVRSQCLPLCKPSMIELHKFDPVACEDEYEKLLSCVTEGGNVSHVHCCRINFVPVFCWEFCHGQMTEAKRSNQFCIYWMPEIFDCYERAYLPFPGPPEKLTVNAINSSALMACWQPPRIRADTVDFYTVRYQEVPRFPFLGGGIPFLTGEGDEVDGSPLSTVRTNPFNSADVSSDRFSDSTALHHREKRQSLLIMTHNLLTNETDVREYKFNEVNTTDTCAVIENLKASTHYLVFATASNSFGVSLPTSKQTAATEAVVYSNSSLPDVYGCCKRNLVSPECISKLCDLNEVPLAFSAFSIAVTCRSEFADVAPCLADGRNHTACCKQKGVGGECLKLCDGTASDLGLTSVLCLSLDMHAIYSCLREGYITHPSPPQNVSVSKQGPFSAIITWDPPVTNADDVQSYSLFVRDSVNKQYDEIKHATSPYELIDLEPNSVVSVYVLAHTNHGTSLKSTVIDFFTGSKEFNFCESGMPLRGPYGEVVKCDKLIDCPAYFVCTDAELDDSSGYCCPSEEFVRPDFHIPVKNITECCQLKGVEQNCLTLCSYNVSVADMFNLGSQCIKDIKTIVDCAGDGRDHRPCCIEADVPDQCLDFCYGPIKYIGSQHFSCVKHVTSIAKCSMHVRLPGPPTNLRLLEENHNWVKLTWDPPEQSVPLEHYEVIISENSRIYSEHNTTDTSIVITTLQPSVEYLAVVLAWNKYGSSVPSNHITFTTESSSESGKLSDDRPLSPHSINKVWYHEGSANITWQWSGLSYLGNTIKSHIFKVMYKKSDAKNWNQIETNESSAVLKDLEPHSVYVVYVTAYDTARGINSFPSETVEFSTWQGKEATELAFVTVPRPPFQIGSSIVVSCVVRSGWVYNLTMKAGDEVVAYGRDKATYTIDSASSSDALKSLLCIGESVFGETVQKRHFLPVRCMNFSLIYIYNLYFCFCKTIFFFSSLVNISPVVSTSIYPVVVYAGANAQLNCYVRSYPMMTVQWVHEHNSSERTIVLPESGRYAYITDNSDSPFSFNVSLMISKVKESDAGFYSCLACNEIDCAKATAYLIVETLVMPSEPKTLLSCCQEKHVQEECLSACTVDIDVSVYVKNPHCMNEFPKLLQCAKDGMDHRSCCFAAEVPNKCLAYCHQSEEVPPHLDCLKFTSEILYCVQEGHRAMPAPPTNVHVDPVPGSGVSLNVSWLAAPKNYKMATTYIVYYQQVGAEHFSKVRTEQPFAILSNLNVSSMYAISVIAANHNGFSSFSPTVSYHFPNADHWDYIASSDGNHLSSAGVLFIVFFVLFLLFAVILSAVYFTRRPYLLPTFLLKLKKRPTNGATAGSVAFENPGYEREGQVRVLPGNGYSTETPAENPTTGWDRAELEAVREPAAPAATTVSEQDGMRYTRFR
ncbi:Ig-like and fibronectin type-III domain-containing protein C25G4.10 [Trichinella zimbabwensis]|uniref:Ig-like and fibronectin type-III domain-containing protein C25G4.10 n=2 Tax=Trichinella zimbabwensis TaxID=268475 RepID=A0A0V1H6Q4_9BILA|nr:Ig-like and fibronectin type-III domain-containing protein C25G4.10 [Trichinella zimbabwensis]